MAETSAKAAGSDDRFEQHLVAGGDLLRGDRIEDAAEEFKAALEIKADDEKALGLLGLAYFRMSAFERAGEVYSRLVQMQPQDASYRLNLGLVHLKSGNPDGAIEELTKSRELDPSQARTVSYLGLAHARNGHYAQAYEAFLLADQSALASEMEPHLDEAQRAEILERVKGGIAESAAADKPAEEPAAADKPAADKPAEEQPAAAAGKGEKRERVATTPPPPPPARTPAVSQQDEEEIVEADLVEMTDAVPEPTDGAGAITQAVDQAGPSAVAAVAATRTAVGSTAPRSLREFATARLVRPEDGDNIFEISAGGVLIVRVTSRIHCRTEGVFASSGELSFEPATRRVRGANTSDAFGEGDARVFLVSGSGYLVASPRSEEFLALSLDEDILYVRENLVFAFEDGLRWESGSVPGSDQKMRVVQFRGTGSMALRAAKPILSIKLSGQRVVYVEADLLAGWVGRVVPRLVKPTAGGPSSSPFVECSGEGIVLALEQTRDTP